MLGYYQKRHIKEKILQNLLNEKTLDSRQDYIVRRNKVKRITVAKKTWATKYKEIQIFENLLRIRKFDPLIYGP